MVSSFAFPDRQHAQARSFQSGLDLGITLLVTGEFGEPSLTIMRRDRTPFAIMVMPEATVDLNYPPPGSVREIWLARQRLDVPPIEDAQLAKDGRHRFLGSRPRLPDLGHGC